MPPTPSAPPRSSVFPARTSPLTHLKRALGWNLGRVLPSARESDALVAAGVTDPVVQRYATWRRSLLLVALGPTLVVLGLALFDTVEGGMHELSPLGVALEGAWLLSMGGLAVACILGLRGWTRPGTASTLLRAAWLASFLLPLVYALVPADLLLHAYATSKAAGAIEQVDRLETLLEIAFQLALMGGTFLQLLPAVLSVIPGAVNGCLRVKSLVPAAQLPGWLLVYGAPVFSLFWLVFLVLANAALRSPLLVLGVLLWAGSPIVYALRSRVFVQSQILPEDARRIAGVKRVVALLAIVGLAMMLTSAFTTKVAGITLLGMDPDATVTTKLEDLAATSDEVNLDDVGAVLDHSKSFVYALDLSSWQLLIDVLAKLLLVTAVFADLVLRATLAAWKNDRALRTRPEASGYDASAAAASAALSTANPSAT